MRTRPLLSLAYRSVSTVLAISLLLTFGPGGVGRARPDAHGQVARQAASDPRCKEIVSHLVDAEITRGFSTRHVRDETPFALGQRKDWPARASGAAAKTAADRAPQSPSAVVSEAPSAERRTLGEMYAGESSDMDAKAGDGPTHYSRTNTQEVSVDEGDIVKTDGRFLYHVSCSRDRESSGCRDELRIYSSWPARQAALLARHRFSGRGSEPNVRQIYLVGNEVVVLMPGVGQLRQGANVDGQLTRVIVLDVTIPKSPRVVREVEIEGAFVESRMIGTRLYLATSSPSFRLPPTLAQEIRETAARTGLTSANEILASVDSRRSELVDAIALFGRDPGLPVARESGSSWDRPEARAIYGCADVNTATTEDGDRLLNVVQIDVAERAQISGAGATGYGQSSIVYASEAAFYVADPTSAASWSSDERAVLGRSEPWSSGTLIRKFELGPKGKPSFAGAGSVRGVPINQFALSEHQGDLRVATSDQWVSNNVYVLRQEGSKLRQIGALEHLAPNERIFAARLMGDRGYLVTFRRTDPLYTLDLSDPRQPRVVGELHIEGFSTYLHPLGNGHLLAIGQDADAWGRPTGLHLQIFDVTDPKQPYRKFHEKLALHSGSIAQQDHHAFMFEPVTNTLSIPWQSDNYWGLVAYRVDPRDGFRDLGRVNHASMYQQYFRTQCAKADVAECGSSRYWYNFVTRPAIAIDRIVAIEDQLYSMSPSGLMVHRVSDRLDLTRALLVATPRWAPRASPVASR